MVGPYPPVRDGIAAYTVQKVRALRAEGHDVEVLSPGPSAAHHQLDLRGPRGALALARRVADYDRVIIQFHPDIFYGPGYPASKRLVETLALLAMVLRAREVDVVVHEIDYRWGNPKTPDGRAMRVLWRSVHKVLMHTSTEAARFGQGFGIEADHMEVIEHGAGFSSMTRHDQGSARALLHIPLDATVFLAIGFIQPHKGFDRAIRAFAGIDPERARLYVVGSVRLEHPEYLHHLGILRELAAETAGVELRDGFVSDELFDRWIVAADVVVLPYREIWSSGVIERASLHGRRVIASDVGGLGEQTAAMPGVTLVADDRALRNVMLATIRGSGPAAEPPSLGWPTDEIVDPLSFRDSIQAAVRNRGALVRGAKFHAGGSGNQSLRARSTSSSAPLRRVPALHVPDPTSARLWAAPVKRLVRRLTAWELDPLVHQINSVQAAAVAAIERATDPRDQIPGSTESQ